MARNQGLIEEGRERFEGALKDMERDWKRLQKRADQGRKQFEQRAQRQVKRIQTGLRKSPLVKRAEEQRKLLERRARKLGSDTRGDRRPGPVAVVPPPRPAPHREHLRGLAPRAEGRPAESEAARAREEQPSGRSLR